MATEKNWLREKHAPMGYKLPWGGAMDATVSIAAVSDNSVSVEFGGFGCGEVEIQFEAGLTLGLSYEQAERLWREMAPYFIADEAKCQRILKQVGADPVDEIEC